MTDLTLANGSIRLAASVDGPMDAVPILLLHGASASRDTWDEAKQELMDRYCVWTLDFRGHGHSDRAPNYDLAGYVSDAEIALAAIGRPAILVGHSLGACVAGVLSQVNPNVRAVFLEDPPWFLGRPEEWARSIFSMLFSILSMRLTKWQQEPPPFTSYVEFLSNGPDRLGGVARDHISARHLLSHASAIQRVDPRCLRNDSLKETLSSISTERPFLCPAKLVRGEERFGAAFWDEHAVSLLESNPHLEIVQYKQCGHHPHRMQGLEARFLSDLQDFIAKTVSGANAVSKR
ncbi:alpha/beta fold hydrolase [Bradyrhizobium sp. STM 3562]|uniref:alpha/beta fold hydrolase n=1 Tax=Bradyrhizobium sp. STM 3562 TaxID=578924 RepID=UPI00388DB3DA